MIIICLAAVDSILINSMVLTAYVWPLNKASCEYVLVDAIRVCPS